MEEAQIGHNGAAGGYADGMETEDNYKDDASLSLKFRCNNWSSIDHVRSHVGDRLFFRQTIMVVIFFLDLTFVSKGDGQAIDLTVLEDDEGVQIQRWKMIITLIWAARHLLQRTVEVNRASIMV